MKRKTLWLCVPLSVLLFAAGFLALQRLLVPKGAGETDDDPVERNFIAEYYGEAKDHDVIFIGDCEVYGNFSPVTLWEEYGINSYIRGSADQYIFQSYYLLEDTFLYEKPKVVVFDVLSLQYGEAQKEEYNRMTLEGMRWSWYKVQAIRASMKEGEQFIEYVFPLLRYHDRWKSLTAADFKYYFGSPSAGHNGYLLRTDVKPLADEPTWKPLGDYAFSQRAWEYMDKIADACEREGVELLLIKAPSVYPHWYDQWEEQVEAYAEKRGLRYVNMLEQRDEIGIDYGKDTYDYGLHMNLAGAEKCSRFLGRILSEEYGLEDRRGEEKLRTEWTEKSAAYYADKREQYEKNR